MQQSDRRHDSAASKEITYTLQEGVEPSSQIDFLEVSKEIPYVLQEGGGENPAVRSTFRVCRDRKRSRTFCRRRERNSQFVNMMFCDYCKRWIPSCDKGKEIQMFKATT